MMQNLSARSSFLRMFLLALLLVAGLALLVPESHAQNYRAHIGGPYGRVFPPQAYRGVLTVVQYPVVELDGERERMVPGTRLIDTSNRSITPASVTGKRLVVNYVRYANGQLHTIWILTPKEAQERRAVANPSWWEGLVESLGSWANVVNWLGY